jgi:hypothetical protein
MRIFPKVPLPPVLPVRMISGTPRPEHALVPHSSLPEHLQRIYKRRHGVYRRLDATGIQWGAYELHLSEGLYTDGPSYPWPMSRYTRDLREWLASDHHDAAYHGIDAFCDDHARNRFMADWCFRDVMLFSGISPRAANRRYQWVRRLGWASYKPRPELHSPNVFRIKLYPELHCVLNSDKELGQLHKEPALCP